MKTAVVILNYNSWRLSIDLVQQFENINGVKCEDIIVIDNNSTDDSLGQLKLHNKKYCYKLLAADKNNGYAAGNNIGLRYAYSKEYDYALVINNDIILKDNQLINKLEKGFSYDTKIAIVSPRILNINGKEASRKLYRPSFMDITFNMFFFRMKNSGLYLNSNMPWHYTYAPQGCCMLLDLKKIAEVDYMDENTFLYGEEDILAERLLNKNYRCICTTNIAVIHNHSTVVTRNIEKKRQMEIKKESGRYLRKKYYGYSNLQILVAELFDNLTNICFGINAKRKTLNLRK